MARLRVRMELSRGVAGVPLEKLARLVDEAQKFFRLLAEDVQIGKDGGEWMGFDFHPKSLNFTAEFMGYVTPGQVREFQAAFDGVTLLRRATIAQFAKIAGAIEENELIGFGLYQNDEETQPSEWRSLSKREALRINEEIRLLSHIPTGLDPKAAANLFRNRRQPAIEERGIEALTERVDRLEHDVSNHSEAIQNLSGASVNTEQNLQKLLTAVDSFCDRATRQMERLPGSAEPAAESRRFGWRIPVTIAAISAIAAVLLFRGGNETRDAADRVQAARPVGNQAPAVAPVVAPRVAPSPVASAPVTPKLTAPPPVGTPAAKPMTPKPALTGVEQKIELKATEPTWVAVHIDNQLAFARLLDRDQTKTIETSGTVRVRLGNAGGIQITANGKALEPIGRKGQVKVIEFTNGNSRIVPPESAPK
jgi:hypothetical protein